TIISLAIVRVPSENLSFELPYACISVLLDGAGLPFFHIVQDCELSDVRMGMRVKARWVADEELAPSIGSIECFVPSDEPDADYETYKEHC
ncbi:MAG: OB-fold domain-containing protein, partial [bacterium]